MAEDTLRQKLSSRVIGQNEAIEKIVSLVEMYDAGLCQPNRPIGTALLLGPTGTGKTHSVEALAECLHGGKNKLIRIDCGEFQYGHEIAKLVGSPPGYLGHKQTASPLSTRFLKDATSPGCAISIILFDEIEKAAQEAHRFLLGIMDKARLILGDGEAVNFEKSIICMTSNIGAERVSRVLGSPYGFPVNSEVPIEELSSVARKALRSKFSPEFVNRIDETIVYRPLTKSDVWQILNRIISKIQIQRLLIPGKNNYELSITEVAKRLLVDRGFSQQYGARELAREVYRSFIKPVARLLGENPELRSCGAVFTLDVLAGEFVIN